MMDTRVIKVSAPMLRLRFIECGPTCVARGCTAKCCDAPSRPSGMHVHLALDERDEIRQRYEVEIDADGFLQPAPLCRGCPFKTADYLCGLHNTSVKPFGCVVSPFMLSTRGVLIVRNRYKLLPCYDRYHGDYAYRVFRHSLVEIFGWDVTDELMAHLDTDTDDGGSWPIAEQVYCKLTEREHAHQTVKGA